MDRGTDGPWEAAICSRSQIHKLLLCHSNTSTKGTFDLEGWQTFWASPLIGKYQQKVGGKNRERILNFNTAQTMGINCGEWTDVWTSKRHPFISVQSVGSLPRERPWLGEWEEFDGHRYQARTWDGTWQQSEATCPALCPASYASHRFSLLKTTPPLTSPQIKRLRLHSILNRNYLSGPTMSGTERKWADSIYTQEDFQLCSCTVSQIMSAFL